MWITTFANHDCLFNDGDSPLAGVKVQLLNEQDDVLATATTDASGRYKFENLAPGTYSVREVQPAGYFHGGQTAGSGGGDIFTDDLISMIFVSAGENYVDYNFCELPSRDSRRRRLFRSKSRLHPECRRFPARWCHGGINERVR
jgi:protocatechuate 3,4-dioxygenase beta subunit